MHQFLKRIVLLTQLQEYWTKGCDVELIPGRVVEKEPSPPPDDVWANATDCEDVKPNLSTISSDIEDQDSTMVPLTNLNKSTDNKIDDNTDNDNDYDDDDDDDAKTIDNNDADDNENTDVYDEDYEPVSKTKRSRSSSKNTPSRRRSTLCRSAAGSSCTPAVPSRTSSIRSSRAKFRSAKASVSNIALEETSMALMSCFHTLFVKYIKYSDTIL